MQFQCWGCYFCGSWLLMLKLKEYSSWHLLVASVLYIHLLSELGFPPKHKQQDWVVILFMLNFNVREMESGDVIC